MSTALQWFESGCSGSEGGDCVEVAPTAAPVHVRGSKAPDGPMPTVSPSTWSEFLDRVTRD
ncbi:DUF397 domain-containing protein [Streptomyces sp900105755]|uniref:DUF397 domain-containing protein n=1 Tax=unclassified Streptomyces TaxID=2593676 RepID=UPI00089912CF|nr:DUF397 domain-containing protein [Streptomyces sp. Ag109_O5-10]SEE51378.1 protein of unknown function [Streptomyces sp. Ag109_O5-10]